MPGVRCDGNDVLATYAVTKRAVERARRGEGPTFIEAMTYRMEAHTTSDDPSRYRTKDELEEAAETDPIARMRNFLDARGLWSTTTSRRPSTSRPKEAATALRERSTTRPHGDPMELFDHVYVDPTGHYERQREQLRAELDRGGDDGEVER
jgi:2-oxoisovalerate dehydrogenase E1 component alpha subunit